MSKIISQKTDTRQYQNCRRTGLDWLGELPTHWKEKPLKLISKHNVSILPDGTPHDHEILYVDISNVNSYGRISEKQELIFGRAPTRARRKVYNGDSIISTVRTYLKAVAYLPKPEANLIVSTGFAVIQPGEEWLSKYQYYLLTGEYFIQKVIALSKGVSYPAIKPSDLVSIKVPLPPLDEQQTIVNFLDKQLERLDDLVEKRKELIKKLREKRSALISHTLTKGLPPEEARKAGLDPNPKLKDSGVQWLGEVPEHWKVVHLKRLWIRAEYGTSQSISGTGEIKVLTMAHLNDGEIFPPDNGCLDDLDLEMLLKDGDLLYNRTNSLAHVGKAALFKAEETPVSFASYLVRLHLEDEVERRFLNFLLNSDNVTGIARRVAIPAINQANLSPTRYGQILVPFPPMQEQTAIADFLETQTEKMKEMELLLGKSLKKLGEYRSALITAAVTGQIDVRKESKDA